MLNLRFVEDSFLSQQSFPNDMKIIQRNMIWGIYKNKYVFAFQEIGHGEHFFLKGQIVNLSGFEVLCGLIHSYSMLPL